MPDRYMATTGSDANSGTQASPVKTLAKLEDVMLSGETGYVNAGDHVSETNLDHVFTASGTSGTPRVIKNVPGTRPRIHAKIRVDSACLFLTVQGLIFDATDWHLADTVNRRKQVSFHIESTDGFVMDNCSVTNSREGGPGIHPNGVSESVHTANWTIKNSRIYRCGHTSEGNLCHGIYASHSTNGLIENCWVYRNQDRGIQLRMDCADTIVRDCVLYENGWGGHHGGNTANGEIASTDTHWLRCLFLESNAPDTGTGYTSTSGWNFYTLSGFAGTGNVVENCTFFGGSMDSNDGSLRSGAKPGGIRQHPGPYDGYTMVTPTIPANAAAAPVLVDPLNPDPELADFRLAVKSSAGMIGF